MLTDAATAIAAIADALGVKVYADDRKRRTLQCLNDPKLTAMLTSDPLSTNVHVTSMQGASLKVRSPPYHSKLPSNPS